MPHTSNHEHFDRVNIILSKERTVDPAGWLHDLFGLVAFELADEHMIVRTVLDGVTDHEVLATLFVRPMYFGADYAAVRQILSKKLNELFNSDDRFLYYSYADGARVLEPR